MAWWLIGLIALAGFIALSVLLGNVSFWKTAARHPDQALRLFEDEDCFAVFTEKPPGGYRKHLGDGEWQAHFAYSSHRSTAR